MNILNNFLNLLFPDRCLGCDEILTEENKFMLCGECAAECEFFSGKKRCRICSAPVPEDSNLCAHCKTSERYFIKNISCARYSGSIKLAIKRYKFSKKPDLYRGLGEILLNELISCNMTDFDVIIAVPVHKNRRRIRGFNQSELLAKYIAQNICVPFEKRALIKVKDIPPQSSLKTPAERRKNVSGAFRVCSEEAVRGKNILLIDDVFTTGATLSEISRILIRSGAKTVCTSTVAMAI